MNKCHLVQKVKFGRNVRYYLLGLALVVMLLDQITKYIVRQNLTQYEMRPVIDHFWNWTLNYNTGAAFSFLASNNGNWPKIFFGIVATLVSIWIINFLLNKTYSLISGLALSFILGGAVGNLVDRIIHGKVTDFIDWYYGAHHWPAFNVADSFICIGVVLMIIEGIFFANCDKRK